MLRRLGVPTPQGRCNANQFSQPFTGPDGALYVAWANYNLTGVRPGEGDDEGGGDGCDATRRAASASTTGRRSCSPSRPTAATLLRAGESYTPKLWMRLKRKAAYLPG